VTKRWDEMDGYIDSRDVIERLDELEDAASEEPTDLGCTACGEESYPDDEIPSLGPECATELRTLRTFAEQGSQVAADWEHGETFIPESDFEDYARELAEDIGAIQSDAGWPTGYIDWPRAAEALKMDYSSIEVEGTTYWARS
jgi:hypothetical protein